MNNLSFINKVVSLKKYRNMLAQLVKRDFKVRYRGSILGILWSVLNPLLYMLVLSLVFSRVFKTIPNYRLYLLSGLVLYNFFSEATNMCVMSIVSNFGLITKVYFPKFVLPLSRVLASLINLGFSLIAFFVLGVFLGISVWWGYILLPVMIVFLLMFTTGIGFMLSTFQVFMRDVQHLYSVIITLWMYATPILYDFATTEIPEQLVTILKINPLYSYVDFFRSITMYGCFPEMFSSVGVVLWGIISFVIGSVVFAKNQNKFIFYT